MDRSQFMQLVSAYIKTDPEAAAFIPNAVAAGLSASQRSAMERAADMEVDSPVAWRYWKDKFGCWEYSDFHLKFPAVPAGTKMEPLYLGPDLQLMGQPKEPQ